MNTKPKLLISKPKFIIPIIVVGLLIMISLFCVHFCKLLIGSTFSADNGIGKVESTVTWHNGFHMKIYGTGNMSEYIPTAWQENLMNLSSGWKISIKKVTIDEGVQSISACAFNGCQDLKQVSIPKSMTFIGSKAFAYCNNLKKVSYAGTVVEWLALIHGSTSWNDESCISEVICSDGVWNTNNAGFPQLFE